METIISSARHRALQLRTARKGGFTAAARRTFLDALAATCNVTLAARAAGFPVRTCYRWRHQHAAFAEAWQEALAIGYDRLETALLDYALACVEAPPIDPEAADPEAIGRSLVTRLRERTISPAELQFAMAMLGRHEAAAKGRAIAIRGGRATAAQTDAVLTKRLDTLARQIAARGK